MKKYVVCFTILLLLSFNVVLAKTYFSDVPTNFWAYDYINNLVELGVLNGYSDGTFKPNNNITTAEFAKVMSSALSVVYEGKDSQTYSDISINNWEYKYVEGIKDYMSRAKDEYGNLYFESNALAIREDIAVALVKALGFENTSMDKTSFSRLFSDTNQISSGNEKYIYIAYEEGILTGYDDGTLNPKGKITRAEVCALITRILKKHNSYKIEQIDDQELSNFNFNPSNESIDLTKDYAQYRYSSSYNTLPGEWCTPSSRVIYYSKDFTGNYIFIRLASENDYIIIPISSTLTNLPDFTYNPVTASIDLTDDYKNYRYSYSNTNIPGTWYTPTQRMLVRDLNGLNYNYVFIKSVNSNTYIIIPISVLPEFAYDRTAGVIDFGSKYELYQYSLSNIISPGTWNKVNTQTLDLSDMDFKYIFISYYQSPDKYIMIELTKVERVVVEDVVDDTTIYTLSFDAKGGYFAPSDIQFTIHDLITIPSVKPSREGYEFIGWSTDPNTTKAEYMPSSTLLLKRSETLYAVWEKQSLSQDNVDIITYNANGGYLEKSQYLRQTISLKNINRLSMLSPWRPGYKFLGWDTDPAALSVEYLPDQEINCVGSLTLYAVWEDVPNEQYTLTYDANGGFGAPSSQTFISEEEIILSSIKPTREGYFFLGWNYLSEPLYPYCDFIPGQSGLKFNSTKTLYATWLPYTYPSNEVANTAIFYDTNGGYFENLPFVFFEYNSMLVSLEMHLWIDSPIREGYKFLGWNTIETAKTAEYVNGDLINSYESVTLYAIWEKE